jgi:hypothetical protein
MTGEVHGIVQDPHDFDHIRLRHTVEDEMPPAPPAARDVERPQTGENLVAGDAPRRLWACRKVCQRRDEDLPVCASLCRAEGLPGPLQNRPEILFSRPAEADSPTA